MRHISGNIPDTNNSNTADSVWTISSLQRFNEISRRTVATKMTSFDAYFGEVPLYYPTYYVNNLNFLHTAPAVALIANQVDYIGETNASSSRIVVISSSGGSFVSISGAGTNANRLTGFVAGLNQDSTTREVSLHCTVPGTLYYSFTVSSEECCDRGFFIVNGTQILNIGGSTTSTSTTAIRAGTNLIVRYSKDSSESNGTDRMTINYLYIE